MTWQKRSKPFGFLPNLFTLGWSAAKLEARMQITTAMTMKDRIFPLSRTETKEREGPKRTTNRRGREAQKWKAEAKWRTKCAMLKGDALRWIDKLKDKRRHRERRVQKKQAPKIVWNDWQIALGQTKPYPKMTAVQKIKISRERTLARAEKLAFWIWRLRLLELKLKCLFFLPFSLHCFGILSAPG